MACNTIIATNLDAGRFDLALLTRVLTDMGETVEHGTAKLLTWRYGRESYDARGAQGVLRTSLEQEIRTRYTRAVIGVTAKRQGLKVEEDPETPGVLRIRTDGRTG